MSPADSSFWDDWYGHMVTSESRDVLMGRLLGLPREIESNNLLPGTAIDEVGDLLGLRQGQWLLDLACGRASWSMRFVAQAAAGLVGVDWSQVALRSARTKAATLGLGSRCHFVRGAMEAVGLADGSVDAAMCLDSLQFSQAPAHTMREIQRVLRRGSRVVITGWEPVLPNDPALGRRVRAMNLGSLLTAAGFSKVTVSERPDWHERERECWTEVLAPSPPGDEGAALADLRREAELTLKAWPRMRRMIAVASAPRP